MHKFGASRHRNFYIAAAVGVGAAALALALDRPLTLVAGVDAFFVVYLGLAIRASRKLSAEFLRKHAEEEDAPAPYILLVMLAAVAASALSFFLALNGDEQVPLQLPLGVAAVVLGWFAVHTMWAFHYAYEYYQAPVGGLEFPGDKEPNGVAFAYFAYVIGMTAQTSDTAVASNNMRKLVLTHGIFSFFFNTVIVAAAVNFVVALAR